MFRPAVCLALSLLLLACGDDADPTTPDAPAAVIDGAAPGDPDAPAADPDAAAPIDAAPADAGVDAKGPPDTCGGACAADEFCETPGGECSAVGSCEPRPAECDLTEEALVCGCDGVTYFDDCVRRMSGVGAAHKGRCPEVCDLEAPAGCCFDAGDCGDPGSLCYIAKCELGGAGRCEPKPDLGLCWEDIDCGEGQFCDGASICPCGTECLVPDTPGTCLSLACEREPTIDACCFDDFDCPPEAGLCRGAKCEDGGEGRCVGKPPIGGCWGDADCAPFEVCEGLFLCPCGFDCMVPDVPGTCSSLPD